MLRRRKGKVDLLRTVPLFAELTKKELEQVAGVADELHLGAGEELTRQGATGREFVVVMEGDVEIIRDGQPVEQVGDGQFYGELALLDDAPRNATVRTKTPARLLVVTAIAFHRLLDAFARAAQQDRAHRRRPPGVYVVARSPAHAPSRPR